MTLLAQLSGFVAELVPGPRARKEYRCPGCGGAVPPGEVHVVAWPRDRVGERRHWHRWCWRLAARAGQVPPGWS